jgi:NADH:ubiquinone oxidoreductase subunit B-like Fe-S oxidoreductase
MVKIKTQITHHQVHRVMQLIFLPCLCVLIFLCGENIVLVPRVFYSTRTLTLWPFDFNNACCLALSRSCAINSAHSLILSRLGLSVEQWIALTTEFEQHFCYAAGAEQMMQAFKTHTHRKRIGGMRQAKRPLS